MSYLTIFLSIFILLLLIILFIVKKYKIFEYIFFSLEDGVIITDLENKVIKLNEAAEKFLDTEGKVLIGKCFGDFLPKKLKECKDIIKAVSYESSCQFTTEKRYLEMKISKLFNANNVHVGNIFFIKDITLQKKYEKNLIAAKKEAIDASMAKSSFLANMSHEIRTPLNGVLGMIELLSTTRLTSNQEKYLSMLHSSATLLYDLINDILDMEKIEAGKIELGIDEINLEDLIYNVLDSVYIMAAKKNVEVITYIDFTLPKYILGDATRIKQIFLNLIGNAIKFTEKGDVVIRVTKEKIEKNKIIIKIVIKDTGIGISKTEISKLFNKFVQVDTSISRRSKGSGLGLVITKELINMMGGDIKVESAEGKGSIFAFSLSLGLINKKIESNKYPGLEDMHVIVISEDKFMNEFMKEVMNAWKVNLKIINDININKFNEMDLNKYKYIIFDIKNYEKDKIIIEKIKKNNQYKNIVLLVLISPFWLEAVRENIFVDKYILKPIKQLELYKELLNLASSSKKDKRERSVLRKEEDIPNKEYKVLIVEDDDVNQEVLSELLLLSGWNLNIDIACNGKDAVEKAKKNKYDLIFMDVQMPEMGGIEATRIIRRIEKGKGYYTPIVALTGSTFKSEIEEFLASGMDEYISKPIKKDILYSTLKKFLKEDTITFSFRRKE